jgi:hypothetical protein
MGGDKPGLFLLTKISKLSGQAFATWRIILTLQFDRAFNAFLSQLRGMVMDRLHRGIQFDTRMSRLYGFLSALGTGFLFFTTRINGSYLRLVR